MDDDRAQAKLDQLETVLRRDVATRYTSTGFETIRFAHNALPEVDFAAIDLSCTFLGRKCRAPLLISSMTGGPSRAEAINTTLAEVAQSLGLAFAVGSQRIALETANASGFSKDLRRRAPDVPILANIGAAQLHDWKGVEYLNRAIDMIEADALIIHLNPLQEVLQDNGDRNWKGVLNRIEEAVTALPCPIVVKEIGCGISAAVAVKLNAVGVNIIDIAGAGGTSWAAVVAESASPQKSRNIAETFRDWGIPTAQAIRDARAALPHISLIASGGMRNGLDAAKALRLGANMVGFAGSILEQTLKGRLGLQVQFEAIIEELRVTAFCTGSQNLDQLRQAPLLIDRHC